MLFSCLAITSSSQGGTEEAAKPLITTSVHSEIIPEPSEPDVFSQGSDLDLEVLSCASPAELAPWQSYVLDRVQVDPPDTGPARAAAAEGPEAVAEVPSPFASESPFDPTVLPDRRLPALLGSPGVIASSPQDRPYWRRGILKRVLGDQKFLVLQWWPSELRRWNFTGPLLAATLTAVGSSGGDDVGYDSSFERSFDARTSEGADSVARGFTRLGNGVPAMLALGTAYYLSRWRGKDRLAEASSLSAEALLNAGLWAELVKRVAARNRPGPGSSGEFLQYNPKPGRDGASFPSGHATGAFAVATVMAREYSDKRWFPWIAYGTAGLIGASRVAVGRHFASDVVAGALLGHSIGRMVLARNGKGTTGPLALSRFQPVFDPAHQSYGVAYAYSW